MDLPDTVSSIGESRGRFSESCKFLLMAGRDRVYTSLAPAIDGLKRIVFTHSLAIAMMA
jgi:hypothetical protein